MNRQSRRRVSNDPARAAIRRGGPGNVVVNTANEWVGGNAAERLVFRPETVFAIGACDGVHRAFRVVIHGVVRGAQGGG